MDKLDFSLWLIVSAIWGSAFLFLEFALDDFPPLSITAFRLLIGGTLLVLWTASLVHHQRIPYSAVESIMNMQDFKILLVLAIVNTIIPVALISYGENFVNSSVASVFSAATPVAFQAIRIVTGEPSDIPIKTVYIGISISVLGLIVTFVEDFRNSGSVSPGITIAGNVLLLLSSISYGFGAYVARKYSKHIHPCLAATCQVSLGAIFSVIVFLPIDSTYPPAGIATRLRFLSTAGALPWLGVFYQGVFSMFIGFQLYFYLINRIGSAKVTASWMTFPVFGVAESVVFLNSWAGRTRRYKVLQCFGAFLVIIGLATILGGMDELGLALQRFLGGKKDSLLSSKGSISNAKERESTVQLAEVNESFNTMHTNGATDEQAHS
jgi:drug/metabolite transporter (DMT)-like permease